MKENYGEIENQSESLIFLSKSALESLQNESI